MSEIPLPVIHLRQGSKALSSLTLQPGQEYVIGRIPKADIVIPHPSVSRMHAKIIVRDDGVFLEDLGSANGTFVNGQRIQGIVKIDDGAVIQTGQKTVSEPIVLYFEDPASRLLKEMGMDTASAASASAEHLPEEEPVEVPVSSESVAGEKQDHKEATEQGEESPVSETETSAPKTPPLWRNPLVIGGGFIGFLVFIGMILLLVRFLRPTATHWKSVQISPVEIQAGTQLVLESQEIEPGGSYSVYLNSQKIEEVHVQRNRLVVEVPDLGLRSAGRHDVILSIRRGDLETFSGMLKYVVSPVIEEIKPTSTHVGESIRIKGWGFVRNRNRVVVKFNEIVGRVLQSQPEEIVVQVPALTRKDPVQAYIQVIIEPWATSYPTPITVGPRIPKPVILRFTQRWDENWQLWLINTQFGSVFPVAGSPPEGEQPPDRIVTVVQKLNRWFGETKGSDELRYDIQIRDGRYRLVLRGERGQILDVICEWSKDELETIAIAGNLEAIPELLPFWFAGVLNQMASVFLKGQTIHSAEGLPAFVAVLNRLVEINLKGGGNGRPDEMDLDLLTEEERQNLADAWKQVPADYGNLTGTWVGELENVFFTIPDLKVRIKIDLKQEGIRLQGEASVEYISPGLQGQLPPSRITGSLVPGAPLKMNLKVGFKRPIGSLSLEGEIIGREIRGTFTRTGRNQKGQWSITRQ